jgi:hypothetical protein
MATKRAQGKAAPASDNSAMWKWLYVAGVVVAGVAAAAGFTNEILTWVLILVGILVAIFYFDSDDLMNFGLRYLILLAVAAAAPLGGVPAVGQYITGFFNGFATFLGPVVLTMVEQILRKHVIFLQQKTADLSAVFDLKQSLIFIHPLEQTLHALCHSDLRLPAQFLGGLADIRVEHALVAGAPIAARHLDGIAN